MINMFSVNQLVFWGKHKSNNWHDQNGWKTEFQHRTCSLVAFFLVTKAHGSVLARPNFWNTRVTFSRFVHFGLSKATFFNEARTLRDSYYETFLFMKPKINCIHCWMWSKTRNFRPRFQHILLLSEIYNESRKC